jgi:hypothetical protein
MILPSFIKIYIIHIEFCVTFGGDNDDENLPFLLSLLLHSGL